MSFKFFKPSPYQNSIHVQPVNCNYLTTVTRWVVLIKKKFLTVVARTDRGVFNNVTFMQFTLLFWYFVIYPNFKNAWQFLTSNCILSSPQLTAALLTSYTLFSKLRWHPFLLISESLCCVVCFRVAFLYYWFHDPVSVLCFYNAAVIYLTCVLTICLRFSFSIWFW